jgi:hypothetical protein
MCSADWRRALLSPWMWAGMLLGANAAMTWLPRRPHGRDALGTLAMCGGGNLGMLAGMAAGGWLAGAVPAGSTATALALAFGGMSAGMLGGMWAGDAAVRFGVPTVGSLAGYSWRLLRAGR